MTVLDPVSHADFEERLLDDGFYADPHSVYRDLRRVEPVYWSEALGCWVVTDYEDVASGLRDKRLSNAHRVSTILDRLDENERDQLQLLYEHFSTGLIHSDPPDHTRLRRLINKSFTPRAMEGLGPRLQDMVDDLLDRSETNGRLEIIHDLASPLPITVIGEILGVPIDDLAEFKGWCDDVNDILAFTPTLEGALSKQESVAALRNFLRELIADRRAHPRDDLLSSLVAVQEEGDRLSEAQLIQTAVTLMIAAHETTTNLIANGLLTLLRNPDQLSLLRSEPSLITSAVEELLRYESPLNHLPRRATESMEIQGKRIREGEIVTFSLLAANRDPRHFARADELDITRPDNDHLAFGFGVHFCLGAPLARVEGQIAIGSLVRRFPSIELKREPSWRRDRVGHGVEALEVGI